MRVGRDLLKQMALACPARPQFDEIVVPLDEWDHADQNDALGALVERGRLKTDRPQQEVDPLRRGEAPPSLEIGRASCRERV